jgi:acetyl esterase/lipase
MDGAAGPSRHVPARDLPIPRSISPEAQALMAQAGQRPAMPGYPALEDKPAWRRYVQMMNTALLGAFQSWGEGAQVTSEARDVDGVQVFVVTPTSPGERPRGVYLDIHGGAFIVGGGDCCRALAVSFSSVVDIPIWSVDYRAPPDHPYPAPLDDCMTVYRRLLQTHPAEEIVVGGGSAGANLAAALVLRARDEGLPMPAGVVLLTPALDMTHIGDSFETNKGLDAVLTGDMNVINRLYAGGHDLADPYLSPLFGDFTKGFCPTFLTAGTRDLFLSNAALMHAKLRAADVPSDLYLIEAGSHGDFHGAPEEAAVQREIRLFVHSCLQAAQL